MLHTISNEYLTVTAAELGAELRSISGGGVEYLWQGDPAYWEDRSPNIFPYVARLTEGSYYMDGELHKMRIHGIAPYKTFSLLSNTGSEMVFELTDDQDTYRQYPRRFAFRVGYSLDAGTLVVTYEVENRDDRRMYFGLGGHPGFNVPLEKGKAFDDYRLSFSRPCRPKRVCFTEDCYLNGCEADYPLLDERYIPLCHELFENDAVVLKDTAHEITLETADGGRAVTVSYPGMDYLGIWHWPQMHAPYVCIEPWCSLPSRDGEITVFEEQEDLLCLEPGRTYRNTWTISVK